jgi:hypothetical protein
MFRVSIQNFTLLGGCANFLCTFIWNCVISELFRSSSISAYARSFVISPPMMQPFLFRAITGDESWIYGYDLETKQQSSQRNTNSKVKSMLIIFFDIKGIVHKEFVLTGQTANPTF